MTLIGLVKTHPHLFYSQDWYLSEGFTTRPTYGNVTSVSVSLRGTIPSRNDRLATAADLADLYVRCPESPLWRDYLWTSDHDARGQRVYVGGTANGHGFEIHRHIHITDRFVVPSIQFA